MEYIDNLLREIKERYGVYIGRKSVHILSVFLSGYVCAVYELTGDENVLLFNSQFQTFVERKNGLVLNTKHWSKIIALNRSDEEAFDLFYELYEEYKGIEKQ